MVATATAEHVRDTLERIVATAAGRIRQRALRWTDFPGTATPRGAMAHRLAAIGSPMGAARASNPGSRAISWRGRVGKAMRGAVPHLDQQANATATTISRRGRSRAELRISVDSYLAKSGHGQMFQARLQLLGGTSAATDSAALVDLGRLFDQHELVWVYNSAAELDRAVDSFARLLAIAVEATSPELDQIDLSADPAANNAHVEWPLKDAGAIAVAALQPLISRHAHPVLVGSRCILVIRHPKKPGRPTEHDDRLDVGGPSAWIIHVLLVPERKLIEVVVPQQGPMTYATVDSVEVPKHTPGGISYSRVALPSSPLISLPPEISNERPQPPERSWLAQVCPGLQALIEPREALAAALSQTVGPERLPPGAAILQLVASHDSRSGHALTTDDDLEPTEEWPLSWWINLTPTNGHTSTSAIVSRNRSDGSLIASQYG